MGGRQPPAGAIDVLVARTGMFASRYDLRDRHIEARRITFSTMIQFGDIHDLCNFERRCQTHIVTSLGLSIEIGQHSPLHNTTKPGKSRKSVQAILLQTSITSTGPIEC